ncbi:putative cysteine desulfurase [Caulifigura coniformis]|uniref:Putative cysteine desulfurase n=1 Tax=Caulifigura coniformis TaxID=2527983 RepID=A0A517SIL3_9PLAN|nr:cysteine desulfurase-like protein [Caulifigura coniformis]QDT55973.1 putative cysteine desulfurase [Caulifigura coniformis]
MAIPLDVASLRSRFPALARRFNDHPAAYFDGAAGSQVPQSVIDAISDVLANHNANRGSAIPTSREADERIEEAHRAFVDFLGAADPAEVYTGQNMTSLTFAMSRALSRTWKPGDEIIVTRLDHDANVTPWTLAARDAGAVVHTIDFHADDCTLDLAALASRLNSRTRLVAVGYASNAVGTINPIAEICRLARSAGALTFIDAVHFAPHGRINVSELGCDFLVCSPYKFFGPHLGVMYGRLEHLERLEAYRLRPAPARPPGKWMTGTQSHESIWGGAAAVDYLASLGGDAGFRGQRLDVAYERIRAHERTIGERLLSGLRDLKTFRLWGIADSSRWDERVPTFSLTHAKFTPQQLCDQLLERGLFTWAGNHYALSFCECCDLEPGGTLRLSLLHYNTQAEVDRLLEALRSFDR